VDQLSPASGTWHPSGFCPSSGRSSGIRPDAIAQPREIAGGAAGRQLAERAGMLRTTLAFSFCLAGSIASAAEAPVVGGTTVPRGKWPDVVAVLLDEGVCTGTLVAPDVVLTAGHCIDGRPREVIVDTIDYGRPGGERIAAAWSRAYPHWDERYDVGVVMLASPARAKPRPVAAACTAREHVVAGEEVRLIGFGLATYTATDTNTRLREATAAITDPTCSLDPACAPAIAPDGEFLAGGQGTDSCFGDSGGPVLLGPPSSAALLGVVSRGLSLPALPCGGGGIYVRADRVAAWIQRVTDRKLVRTSCSGRADEDAAAEPAGGCAAGSPSGAAGALLAAFGLRRRRATRRPSSRPDRRGFVAHCGGAAPCGAAP
jgi:hypothetical protein